MKGHGKSGELDGTVFGMAGIAGALLALVKKERLRSTAQFVKFFREWRLRKEANWSPEKKGLVKWVALL